MTHKLQKKIIILIIIMYSIIYSVFSQDNLSYMEKQILSINNSYQNIFKEIFKKSILNFSLNYDSLIFENKDIKLDSLNFKIIPKLSFIPEGINYKEDEEIFKYTEIDTNAVNFQVIVEHKCQIIAVIEYSKFDKDYKVTYLNLFKDDTIQIKSDLYYNFYLFFKNNFKNMLEFINFLKSPCFYFNYNGAKLFSIAGDSIKCISANSDYEFYFTKEEPSKINFNKKNYKKFVSQKEIHLLSFLNILDNKIVNCEDSNNFKNDNEETFQMYYRAIKKRAIDRFQEIFIKIKSTNFISYRDSKTFYWDSVYNNQILDSFNGLMFDSLDYIFLPEINLLSSYKSNLFSILDFKNLDNLPYQLIIFNKMGEPIMYVNKNKASSTINQAEEWGYYVKNIKLPKVCHPIFQKLWKEKNYEYIFKIGSHPLVKFYVYKNKNEYNIKPISTYLNNDRRFEINCFFKNIPSNGLDQYYR